MLILSSAGLALLGAACGDDSEPRDPRITALWEAPHACGAPAYAWVEDPSLGSVVAFEEEETLRYDVVTLRAALQLAEVDFPRELLYDTRMYIYRYVTQDRGALTEATAVITVPDTAEGDPRQFPVISFLHGTSGFSDTCAASVGLLYPAVAAALSSAGYIVVAPDGLGMNGLGAPSTQRHTYMLAEPTAIATLDAIRAGRSLVRHDLGVDLVAEKGVLLMGGSQGGYGVLATVLYGPYYAPDQEILAATASVPPSDLLRQAAHATLQWQSGSSNFTAIAAALAEWYGADLGDVLLPPHLTQVPELMESECRPRDLVPDATSVETVYTEGFRDQAAAGFTADTPWACVLRENSIATSSVEPLAFPPTLIVLSEDDDLVNTPIEREAFDALCARGYRLEYVECAGVGHTDAALGSFGEQIDFLTARYAGDPWPEAKQCQRSAPIVCSGTEP